jgi:hypothetical protein
VRHEETSRHVNNVNSCLSSYLLPSHVKFVQGNLEMQNQKMKEFQNMADMVVVHCLSHFILFDIRHKVIHYKELI